MPKTLIPSEVQFYKKRNEYSSFFNTLAYIITILRLTIQSRYEKLQPNCNININRFSSDRSNHQYSIWSNPRNIVFSRGCWKHYRSNHSPEKLDTILF